MSQHIKMIFGLSIGLLIVFAWHYATVLGFIGTAPQTQSEFFIRIGSIFGIFFIASVITAIMVAKHNENAPLPDEREEKIELKVERVSVVVLYLSLAVVAWFAFLPMTPMQVANAILGAICVTEIIKLLTVLYYLKRDV